MSRIVVHDGDDSRIEVYPSDGNHHKGDNNSGCIVGGIILVVLLLCLIGC